MAFCGKCGTDLKDMAFCPNCGTPAAQLATGNGGAVVVQQPKDAQDIRQDSLNLIHSVFAHFMDIQSDYVNFIAQSDELETRRKKNPLALMFAAPLFWIAGIAVGGIVGSIFQKIAYGILTLIIMIIAIAVSLPAPFILAVRNNKQNKARIAELEKSTKELADAIVQNYNNFEGKMPIGFEYYNFSALTSIQQMLESGRAEKISDAINLIRQDAHQARLEDQIAATRLAAETAAANSATAAANSAAAAWFSAGAYNNTK